MYFIIIVFIDNKYCLLTTTGSVNVFYLIRLLCGQSWFKTELSAASFGIIIFDCVYVCLYFVLQFLVLAIHIIHVGLLTHFVTQKYTKITIVEILNATPKCRC